MPHRIWPPALSVLILIALATASTAVAGDHLLTGLGSRTSDTTRNNIVHQRGPVSTTQARPVWNLPRAKAWSLPTTAIAPNVDTVIHVLVLRFNFQYETVDDSNTTGRGVMDLTTPFDNPLDSARYYDSVGFIVDPPPHNAAYFNAHMKALNFYWNRVSEGHDSLAWDIYPRTSDSVYQLPHEMAYYGKCEVDSVVAGLERYFVDGIHTADADPSVDFTKYDAIIMFHAGADRQNDLGFPLTCSDLFTGFINFRDSVAVKGGKYVHEAVMMPEAVSQDNRATALNAVIAHEFGHQLGLVDLYNTSNFMTQLGDFSLMDDNGFGTGIDFGFKAGKVFGAVPVYPDAWSRAYLGYVPVSDFRKGSNLRIVAAEAVSSGMKIARVPISENSFYLLENRNVRITDTLDTLRMLVDSTNVFLGPSDKNRNLTGEYDFNLPGSGMLIYLVDEYVAGLDYDGNGVNNFKDNQLQWDPRRRFISIVEASGIVRLGGDYHAGYGSADDMYRDDRNTALTPNTNPPAFDNTGANTHVYITNIGRDTIRYPGEPVVTRLDSVMRFDVETDNLATGFPVRAGYPTYGLSPVFDDIAGDGQKEVVVASGKLLSVFTADGQSFLNKQSGCPSPPIYYDTAKASTNPGTPQPVPIYAITPAPISAGPVTGQFLGGGGPKYIAIGYPEGIRTGAVALYRPLDNNCDGLADPVGEVASTTGVPIAMSFGKVLWILTDSGVVYHKLTPSPSTTILRDTVLPGTAYDGVCKLGDSTLVVLAHDATRSMLCCVQSNRHADSLLHIDTLDATYTLGPVAVDMNLDGQPEVVAFSTDGKAVFVTVDTSGRVPSFSTLASAETGFHFTVNPIAADVDLDGSPDIVIGGSNAVYAFSDRLVLKTDFPIEVDDRYPSIDVISALVVGDIDRGGKPELVFPSNIGNIYSFGNSQVDVPMPANISSGFPAYHKTTGFPLPGGQKGAGSCLIFHDSTMGKLGYLGVDGWFYAWNADFDTLMNFWPMGGADPAGSFTFNKSKLGPIHPDAPLLFGGLFYNYPNPVTGGNTTFRYTLGEQAQSVKLTVYDLSGRRVREIDGSRSRGENSQPWYCGDITPGVYRCRIEVDFGSETQTGFVDVAIIR